MNVTFKNKRLETAITDPKELVKTYGIQRAKKIKQRYQEMLASATLQDLGKIPATDLHQLTGDRTGQWAVKVTGNERLCFIITHDPVPSLPDNSVDRSQVTDVCIVFIGDYH
ncbi:MAG TPA: hypothetical protein PKB07_07015 [Flavilitoribacter sp.]|nr:hypothetical protein [Flavilitoribacter sp.]